MNSRSRVIAYALIAAFGGFVFGYDTAVISGAVGYITGYFHLSPVGTGWAVASALVGCVFGAASVGALGSRLGRRKTLMLAAACYFASGVGTAFAWSFTSFWLFRLLGGLAIGLTSTAPLYISEIAPKEGRGRLTMLYQVAITFGVLVVFVANWRIAQIGTDDPWSLEHGWRWMLGSVTVPAGLFVALLFFLPESPRWLLLQGRDRAARAVLELIATPAQADAVLKDYIADRSVPQVTHISLTHPSVLRLLVIACALAILQQVVGINAVIYHGIKMMSELIPGGRPETAFSHQVLIGFALFLSTFIGLALVDHWGRKPLWLLGSLGLSATILTVGGALYAHAEGHWLLGVILLYIVFFGATLGPLTWVMLPELAPDATRAHLMAVATLCTWMTNALVSQTFPMINESLVNRTEFNGALPFFLYGVGGLLAFVFVWRCVPETKGSALVRAANTAQAPSYDMAARHSDPYLRTCPGQPRGLGRHVGAAGPRRAG